MKSLRPAGLYNKTLSKPPPEKKKEIGWEN
jgi:hypothetical protein